MSNGFTDSVGNPITEGCILRIYHFTGARKKRHYMYKQVGKYSEKCKKWRVYHLPIKDMGAPEGYYTDFFRDSVVVESPDLRYAHEDLKRNPRLRD